MSTNMDSFSQESFLNGSQAQGFTVSSSLENPNPAMADANSMEFKPSNIEIKKTYHQFRNETEIKGESKGDYLKGRIALPPIEDPDFFFCIRLRLCPGEDSPENPLLLYPNLFFLQGKDKKFRQRGLTDKDYEIILYWSKNIKIFNEERQRYEQVLRDKPMLIALDRGVTKFCLPNPVEVQGLSQVEVQGMDVSDAIEGGYLYLGCDPTPSGRSDSPDSGIDVKGSDNGKVKANEQVKLALRINIVKAAQKSNTSAHTPKSVMEKQLDDILQKNDGFHTVLEESLDEDTVKNLVDKHHVRAENLNINQHQDYIVPLHGNGLLVPTGPYRAELKQKIVENLANKMKFSGDDSIAMHMARLKVEVTNMKDNSIVFSEISNSRILNTNGKPVAPLNVKMLYVNKFCQRTVCSKDWKIMLELHDAIQAKYVQACIFDGISWSWQMKIQPEGRILILRWMDDRPQELEVGKYSVSLYRKQTGSMSEALSFEIVEHPISGRCFCEAHPNLWLEDPSESQLPQGKDVKPKRRSTSKRQNSGGSNNSSLNTSKRTKTIEEPEESFVNVDLPGFLEKYDVPENVQFNLPTPNPAMDQGIIGQGKTISELEKEASNLSTSLDGALFEFDGRSSRLVNRKKRAAQLAQAQAGKVGATGKLPTVRRVVHEQEGEFSNEDDTQREQNQDASSSEKKNIQISEEKPSQLLYNFVKKVFAVLFLMVLIIVVLHYV